MLLTITNLYPRPDEPERGLFNMQFFDRLSRCLEARSPRRTGETAGGIVNICLVPSWRVRQWPAIRAWCCPHSASVLTRYLPAFYIPVVGRDLSWATYARALRAARREAQECSAILATWLYADAVAAAGLAREAKKPLWIKVHGSDALHLKNCRRRRRILNACNQAAGVLCVSRLLADELREAGVEDAKLHFVPNGVDRKLFSCAAGTEARQAVAGQTVLFVGHLVGIKGPDLLLEAWRKLQGLIAGSRRDAREPDNLRLVIVGEGGMRGLLAKRARRLGIEDSVAFLGARPHAEIARLMKQADCLCLPSRSEGMPNVVLESLACGTPVVATDVGEIPFLIKGEINGQIVPHGAQDLPQRLAAALHAVLRRQWDHDRIAAGIDAYTWENAAETAAGLIAPH